MQKAAERLVNWRMRRLVLIRYCNYPYVLSIYNIFITSNFSSKLFLKLLSQKITTFFIFTKKTFLCYRIPEIKKVFSFHQQIAFSKQLFSDKAKPFAIRGGKRWMPD
jgi:hypothetical protein